MLGLAGTGLIVTVLLVWGSLNAHKKYSNLQENSVETTGKIIAVWPIRSGKYRDLWYGFTYNDGLLAKSIAYRKGHVLEGKKIGDPVTVRYHRGNPKICEVVG